MFVCSFVSSFVILESLWNLCQSFSQSFLLVRGVYLENQWSETIHISTIGTLWVASQENRIFVFAKTKAQISFAVTAKLISAFVFATRIVQFLFYFNPKFQASSSLLCLYRPVCVRPVRKPRRPLFLRRGSYRVCFVSMSSDPSFGQSFG